MADAYTLIKPFTTSVNGSGFASVMVSHSINGLAWEVVQIGMALGQLAPSPQCAAMINGIPFVSAVVMGTSVFSSLTGSAPIAMTSEFAGPPYPVLEAGDQLTVGVLGANPGDVFTVGAYINEIQSPAAAAAVYNAPQAGYIARPGRGRWSRGGA